MERKNSQEGITLVALVITIIVLIILAGVTIGTLVGDNGIIIKRRKSIFTKYRKCNKRNRKWRNKGTRRTNRFDNRKYTKRRRLCVVHRCK